MLTRIEDVRSAVFRSPRDLFDIVDSQRRRRSRHHLAQQDSANLDPAAGITIQLLDKLTDKVESQLERVRRPIRPPADIKRPLNRWFLCCIGTLHALAKSSLGRKVH